MADEDNITIDRELLGATEWDDALIKHGIKEAPKAQLTDDEITSAIAEAKQSIAAQNPFGLQHKSLTELDECEDDVDADLLQKYRQQRLTEMKHKLSRSVYGSVAHIAENEYKQQVTDSSVTETVFVLLFVYSQPECQLLLQLLETVASQHKTYKFVKIEATKAIHNYPASSCPTLLVYQHTNISKQYVGLSEFGGIKSNAKCVTYVLAKDGFLSDVDVSGLEDPREALTMTRTKINLDVNKNGVRSTTINKKLSKYSSSDSSDDSSDDD